MRPIGWQSRQVRQTINKLGVEGKTTTNNGGHKIMEKKFKSKFQLKLKQKLKHKPCAGPDANNLQLAVTN